MMDVRHFEPLYCPYIVNAVRWARAAFRELWVLLEFHAQQSDFSPRGYGAPPQRSCRRERRVSHGNRGNAMITAVARLRVIYRLWCTSSVPRAGRNPVRKSKDFCGRPVTAFHAQHTLTPYDIWTVNARPSMPTCTRMVIDSRTHTTHSHWHTQTHRRKQARVRDIRIRRREWKHNYT